MAKFWCRLRRNKSCARRSRGSPPPDYSSPLPATADRATSIAFPAAAAAAADMSRDCSRASGDQAGSQARTSLSSKTDTLLFQSSPSVTPAGSAAQSPQPDQPELVDLLSLTEQEALQRQRIVHFATQMDILHIMGLEGNDSEGARALRAPIANTLDVLMSVYRALKFAAPSERVHTVLAKCFNRAAAANAETSRSGFRVYPFQLRAILSDPDLLQYFTFTRAVVMQVPINLMAALLCFHLDDSVTLQQFYDAIFDAGNALQLEQPISDKLKARGGRARKHTYRVLRYPPAASDPVFTERRQDALEATCASSSSQSTFSSRKRPYKQRVRIVITPVTEESLEDAYSRKQPERVLKTPLHQARGALIDHYRHKSLSDSSLETISSASEEHGSEGSRRDSLDDVYNPSESGSQSSTSTGEDDSLPPPARETPRTPERPTLQARDGLPGDDEELEITEKSPFEAYDTTNDVEEELHSEYEKSGDLTCSEHESCNNGDIDANSMRVERADNVMSNRSSYDLKTPHNTLDESDARHSPLEVAEGQLLATRVETDGQQLAGLQPAREVNVYLDGTRVASVDGHLLHQLNKPAVFLDVETSTNRHPLAHPPPDTGTVSDHKDSCGTSESADGSHHGESTETLQSTGQNRCAVVESHLDDAGAAPDECRSGSCGSKRVTFDGRIEVHSLSQHSESSLDEGSRESDTVEMIQVEPSNDGQLGAVSSSSETQVSGPVGSSWRGAGETKFGELKGSSISSNQPMPSSNTGSSGEDNDCNWETNNWTADANDGNQQYSSGTSEVSPHRDEESVAYAWDIGIYSAPTEASISSGHDDSSKPENSQPNQWLMGTTREQSAQMEDFKHTKIPRGKEKTLGTHEHWASDDMSTDTSDDSGTDSPLHQLHPIAASCSFASSEPADPDVAMQMLREQAHQEAETGDGEETVFITTTTVTFIPNGEHSTGEANEECPTLAFGNALMNGMSNPSAFPAPTFNFINHVMNQSNAIAGRSSLSTGQSPTTQARSSATGPESTSSACSSTPGGRSNADLAGGGPYEEPLNVTEPNTFDHWHNEGGNVWPQEGARESFCSSTDNSHQGSSSKSGSSCRIGITPTARTSSVDDKSAGEKSDDGSHANEHTPSNLARSSSSSSVASKDVADWLLNM